MATLVPVCDMNASSVFSGGINYAIRQNDWNYYLGSTVPGAYIFYYGTNSVCAFLPNGDGFTVGEGFRHTGVGIQEFYTVNTTNTGGNVAHVTVDGVLYRAWVDGNHDPITRNPSIPVYETIQDGIRAIIGSVTYPLTYHYTNSTVSGPAKAAVGDTVTVSAVPNNNYGITDPATQILVTNNDVAVSYQWNPSTNTITFVMPDPT